MKRLMAMFLLAGWCVAAGAPSTVPATAPATTQEAPKPAVLVAASIEEGKRTLVATVTLAGKPVEGAKVAFYVRRTFGDLLLGEEDTLDDGTAGVLFPQGLPGGRTGELQVLAVVKATQKYASATGEATVTGAPVVHDEADPFPRALWAPHAPFPLILTIFILLGGVWCTYVFVIGQLIKMRKGE